MREGVSQPVSPRFIGPLGTFVEIPIPHTLTTCPGVLAPIPYARASLEVDFMYVRVGDCSLLGHNIIEITRL